MAESPLPSFSGVGLLALLGLILLPGCWDRDPVGVDTSALEILIVKGSGQGGEPGALLPGPLEVRVRKISNGNGVEDVKVRWEVLGSTGATVDPSHSFTDASGLASTRLTLGPEVGTYRVRAWVAGMESSPAEFDAEALLTPVLSQVPSATVQPGDTVLLQGRNFSPEPDKNVVTFSQVRGRVTSASTTEIRVQVPTCLPTREVSVKVQIGGLPSSVAVLDVEGPAVELALDRGEDLVLDASEGFACVHLPSADFRQYLVVPHSTSTVGGGVHDYTLAGLTQDEAAPVPVRPGSEQGPPGVAPSGWFPKARLEGVAHWQFEEQLRDLERKILSESGPGRRARPLQATPEETSPIRTPALGDRREFSVLNRDNGFDRVTAQVRYLTDHAVVYLDENVPEGGFTDADLSRLALEFEDPVYPTVTEVFGAESDLDGNGRIVILLTPGVNRLTEPGSDGFVGGFFFGLDLLTGREGSNEGEIFYALVPDPGGVEGPALSRSTVLSTIPAILAHEFQHMVHFNQRLLIAGAESQDALWLSEALAQMAEDLVGQAFENLHLPDKAYQYRVGNWIRARRFLENPGEVSVLASLPPGTLAERGAGWLLLKHVSGRPGNNDILRTLVSSRATGIQNLTQASGRAWEELLVDWAGALYLDGTGLPVRPELQMSGIDLRASLANLNGTYPLKITVFGGGPFSVGGSLWSSAPDYFIIRPPVAGGLALSATGVGGLPPEEAMGLRLLVVRLW